MCKIATSALNIELTCPICLGICKQTTIVKEVRRVGPQPALPLVPAHPARAPPHAVSPPLLQGLHREMPAARQEGVPAVPRARALTPLPPVRASPAPPTRAKRGFDACTRTPLPSALCAAPTGPSTSSSTSCTPTSSPSRSSRSGGSSRTTGPTSSSCPRLCSGRRRSSSSTAAACAPPPPLPFITPLRVRRHDPASPLQRPGRTAAASSRGRGKRRRAPRGRGSPYSDEDEDLDEEEEEEEDEGEEDDEDDGQFLAGNGHGAADGRSGPLDASAVLTPALNAGPEVRTRPAPPSPSPMLAPIRASL